MATDKRERQRARKAAREEAARAARARARRNRLVAAGAVLAAAVVVGAILLAGGDGGTDESTLDATDAPTTVTAPKPYDPTCPPSTPPKQPRTLFTALPPDCLEEGKTYTAVVETNLGTVEVELDAETAPTAVNNFVFLSGWRYYDDTKIFRTESTTGIIQGGSPHTQDNSDDGPGYTFGDEGVPFPAEAYKAGALAMANHGPDTNGGQFFFLATDGASYLGQPAEDGGGAGAYVVFGQTTKGLDVLEEIAASDDGSGAPSKDIRIESIRIRES